jgi:uncharacterized delta-60 repeat protein
MRFLLNKMSEPLCLAVLALASFGKERLTRGGALISEQRFRRDAGHVKGLALAGVAAALLANCVRGQPGTADPSFSFAIAGVDQIRSIALAAEGKILIGCTYEGYGAPVGCVARLNSNGEQDLSFKVGTGAFGSSVLSILVQPDAKILVGGAFTNYNGIARNSIVRLNPDGNVDTSFDPGTGFGFDAGSGFVGSVWQMVPQPGGQILAMGGFTRVNGIARGGLARLNSDGSLDAGFAPVLEPLDFLKVVAQTDGKILVSGHFTQVNGEPRVNLARLNTDGSLDESFNASLNEWDWNQADTVDAIALQSDGQILLGGSFIDRIGHSMPEFVEGTRVLTLRLNSDGTADPSFVPLMVIDDTLCCGGPPSINSKVQGLVVQNDGKILISGEFSIVNGIRFGNLARLNPDGALDGNFDSGTGADCAIGPIVLDKDGKVLIPGCFQHFNGLPASLLLRVLGGEPAPSAPVFKNQPVVEVFDGGQTLAFSALVSAMPLATYQWQLNGQDLPGATHATMVLTNVTPGYAGSYQLRVSNSLGSATSQSMVLSPPTILVQPLPQAVQQGEDAAFSVTATNLLPLSFQWQLEGTNVFGATNATLTLSGVGSEQAGRYTAIVSDSVGSVTSAAASLTVLPPTTPDILLQPRSQTVEVGMEVSFSVVATNYLPLTYQWQFNSVGIPGATNPTLTLPNVQLPDAGPYRVVVSSEFRSVASGAAVLVVKPVEFIPGPGVVTNVTQASLEAALASGAPVTFGVNGVIPLTKTIVIATDATLDASGRSITLDGQNAVRHFVVTNGVTLRLVNLKLANGRYTGVAGQTNQTGQAGWGGSIYNLGGILELIGCAFLSNQVTGGTSGPVNSYDPFLQGMDGGPAYGGAIYSMNGQLSVTNCLFANNRCTGGSGYPDVPASGNPLPYSGGGGDSFGGTIYSTNSLLTLVEVVFTNNVAQGGEMGCCRPLGNDGAAYGGALANAGGKAAVSNCVFAANQASAPQGKADGNGGAIFHTSGAMTIDGTLFIHNIAHADLGANYGPPVISGPGRGGAIFNSGSLDVQASAFVLNEAHGGDCGGSMQVVSLGGDANGGAICDEGSLRVINCTLAENSARGGTNYYAVGAGGSAYGGAVFSSSTPSFLNVTIAGNSVQAGFGSPTVLSLPRALGSAIALTNSAAFMTNTILACQPAQTNVAGGIFDGGHNICSDASAGFTSPSSRSSTDPLLAPLGDNGGPTPTLALLPGSPAIDAGDDSACPPTDQRGVSRPQGLSCDIGAFELTPKLTLTRGPGGIVTLDYTFRAGQTNQISGSTNLINWVPLGTKMSDANGLFDFEDPDAPQFDRRFYKVQIQPGP